MRKGLVHILKYGDKRRKQLEQLPFNRNISDRPELRKSLIKLGFIGTALIIHTNVITGKNEYYILDGQHRISEAMKLGIDFKVEVLDINITSKKELLDLLSSINTSQKSWTVADYVNGYKILGSKDYATLQYLSNKYAFSLSETARCLTGPGVSTSVLKNGTFKVKREAETKELFEYAQDLEKYSKLTGRMLRALNHVFHNTSFNKVKFKSRYIKNIKEVKLMKLDNYTDHFQKWGK